MSEPSIQISLCGGLGNQLFQILTMLEISSKQNIPYYISNEDLESSSIFKPRPTYWNSVFRKLKFTKKIDIPMPICTIKETDSNIFINFDPVTCPTILEGYFQCSKYFTKETFKKYINYSSPEAEEIWNNLRTGLDKNTRNIFIHVRRGDYMQLQYFHIVLGIEWYKKALENFSENDNFFIFSEDLDWCRDNFGFLKNKFFVSSEDYNEMFLMGKCDGGIMSASSFSWFGAYIASLEKSNIKIVCPNIWFRDYVNQKGRRNMIDWVENIV